MAEKQESLRLPVGSSLPQIGAVTAADQFSERQGGVADVSLPRGTGVLRPLVDAFARTPSTLRGKLRVAFLIGALLVVGVGVLGLLALERTRQQVGELALLHDRLERTYQLEALVASQRNDRALEMLTNAPSYHEQIVATRKTFLEQLAIVEGQSPASDQPLLAQVRDDSERLELASRRVQDMYVLALHEPERSGDVLLLYQTEEQPIAEALEGTIRRAQDTVVAEIGYAQAMLSAEQRLFNIGILSGTVAGAVLLLLVGFLTTWSVVRPVRAINEALVGVLAGDRTRRVAAPNRDEFGQVANNLNIVIADLVRLENEQHDAATDPGPVVDNAPDSIITVDEHGMIRSFNPASARLFGYSELEVVGRKLEELLPEVYFADSTEPGDVAAQGETNLASERHVMTGHRKDGTTFPLELSAGEMRIDGQRVFIGIMRDIH